MEPILDDKLNQNPDDYRPCFNCEETDYEKLRYTWWGGMLGPRLLHHVKCRVCGTHYNGKTGRSNNPAIFFYSLFFLGLFLVIFIFITF